MPVIESDAAHAGTQGAATAMLAHGRAGLLCTTVGKCGSTTSEDPFWVDEGCVLKPWVRRADGAPTELIAGALEKEAPQLKSVGQIEVPATA